MEQLELPLAQAGAPDRRFSVGIPRDLRGAFLGEPYWLETTTIVPGRPFVIWAQPSDPDDVEAVRAGTEKVFEAYRSALNLWKWCHSSYYFDPETGASAIVAMPFRTAKEMVVGSIGSFMNDVSRNLIFAVSSSASALTNLMPSSADLQPFAATGSDKPRPSQKRPRE